LKPPTPRPRAGAMNQRTTFFETLADALKKLEPIFRDDRLLMTGKPLRPLGDMRPREACANWLICAALNEARGASLMFGSDPTRGDGVIFDSETGCECALTEHVIAVPSGDANVEALILRAVEGKRSGESYAAGKTLVVYLAANGRWRANVVARQLPNPLLFADVYVISREGIEAGEYVYGVAFLDVAEGDAPSWQVRIAKDFASWTVVQRQ
jgi:hypothetical protein